MAKLSNWRNEPLPAEKTCSACNTSKALAHFTPDPRYVLGVKSACTICRRAQIKRTGMKIAAQKRPPVAEKICCACKACKPASQFVREPCRKSGLSARCSHCRQLWGRYRLSSAEFHSMVAAQNNCCDICDCKFTMRPRVDHCHATGKVRGLLCARCNMWLAAIEDPVFAEKARTYLAKETPACLTDYAR